MFDKLKEFKFYDIYFYYFPLKLKESIKDILYKIIESYSFIKEYVIPIKILNKRPILIYTMEKSSSTSLHFSLLDSKVKNVFRFHYFNPSLNPETIKHLIYMQSKNPKRLWKKPYMAFWLYKNVILKNKMAKVIILIRNPLERAMSKLFHSFPIYIRKDLSNLSITDLYDFFLNSKIIDDTLLWIEREPNKVFESNLYNHYFNRKKEYSIITIKNFEILLLKTNLENDKKEKILTEFLNLKNKLRLINYNTNKNKNNLYSEFKNNITFPDFIKNKIYNSNYYNHYFR